jgi:hypothetical protein
MVVRLPRVRCDPIVDRLPVVRCDWLVFPLILLFLLFLLLCDAPDWCVPADFALSMESLSLSSPILKLVAVPEIATELSSFSLA